MYKLINILKINFFLVEITQNQILFKKYYYLLT